MKGALVLAVLGSASLLASCTTPPPPRADKVPTVAEGVGARLPLLPPLPPRVEAPLSVPDAQATTDRLGPGVVVRIDVTGEEALSRKRARVGPAGRVFVPFLGPLDAEGLAPAELAVTIAKAYRDRGYLKHPEVQVEVLDASGRKAYVLGRVRQPGAYDLPFSRPLTLTQVLAMAGGLATAKHDLEADPSAVRLIRQADGLRRTYRLSLLEILNDGKLGGDVPIQDGDVIYVPPKPELFIFGSVNRPGAFPLADGSRLGLEEALGLSGGFTTQADPARIILIRRTSRGGVTYRVPTDPAERAGTQVTANDTIIVPTRSVSRVYVLGSVNRQGGIPLDFGDLTVTKALALAGGLTRIAAANSVQLIRTVNGERRVFAVPVADIIAGGDVELDPLLQPGDLIWVPEGFF